MRLHISADECGLTAVPHVDRSGSAQESGGPEGFLIYFGDLTIEFEDERGAVGLARAILRRMGEEL